MCINSTQCSIHVSGGECEGLMVCREDSLSGLVVPVKAGMKVVVAVFFFFGGCIN